jgi:hypothetical protein
MKRTSYIRQGSKPTGGNGKSSKQVLSTLANVLRKKGNTNVQNERRRRTEVNVNTNFSLFNSRRRNEEQPIIIEKEEPVGVIASSGSSAFGICATYAINPGQANLFPILSQEAAPYEKYKFDLLEFFTIPLVSEYATGGQQGELALAVNFNPSLPPPVNQTATLSLSPIDANLPCLPLRISCQSIDLTNTNAKFVRTGNLPGQSDIKEYDVGNLFVTCEGLSATNFNVARLFVRYRCKLYTRVVVNSIAAPINMSAAILQDFDVGLSASNTPHTFLWTGVVTGGAGYLPVYNGINVTNNAGTISLPAGNYLIDFSGRVQRDSGANTLTEVLAVIYFNGTAIQYAGIDGLSSTLASFSMPSLFIPVKSTDTMVFAVNAYYTGANDFGCYGTLRIISI